MQDPSRDPARWHAQRRRAILRAHPEVKRLYGHAPGTALWVIALAGVQVALTLSVSRPANKVETDPWMVANWGVCIAYGAAVLGFAGLKAFVFGLVAALAAFGPHPMGGRRLAEHLTGRRGQPTNSYYGVLNVFAFDQGYHVEHHDFPNVPWSRLRLLHRMAPEFYESLHTVPSWSLLMARHVLDPRYRVDQYVGMGGAWLEDPVIGGKRLSSRHRAVVQRSRTETDT